MAQYQLHVAAKPNVKIATWGARYDQLVFMMKECDFRQVSLGVFRTRFDDHMDKDAHLQMFMLSVLKVGKMLQDADNMDSFKYKDTFSFAIARVNDYSVSDRLIWG